MSAEELEDTEDLFNLSLTELMDVEVVTAGRQLQKISEAPSAMSVITADDIRQLGATSLGEALKMEVGVDFGYTNSSYMGVGGIRGFHKIPANKVILLIDGVPWTFEVYGMPMIHTLPISLWEIERIEVLRGPGSSLYGANAMFGVINIITKSPADTEGAELSVIAGEQNTMLDTLMLGGSVKDKFYSRIAAEWSHRDSWDYIAASDDPVESYWKVDGSFLYQFDDASNLSFVAGYMKPDELYYLLESTGPINWKNSDTYRVVMSYTAKNPEIKFRIHHKNMDWGDGSALGARPFPFTMGTSGFDIQQVTEPLDSLKVLWGGNFTQEHAEGPAIGGKHTHDMMGIFIDNTYQLTQQLILNGGLRLDHHPNTENTISHRLALMYQLGERHHLRATWGSSFRNPDFIESYYNSYTPYTEGRYLHVYGQKENSTEQAQTYELAYFGQVTERASLNLNLFYSDIKDFIYFAPFGDPYMDERIGGVVIPYPFQNLGDAEQYGAEIEIKYQFTTYLSGRINYCYMDQKEKDPAIKPLLQMTPEHMVNAQLKGNWHNGISASFSTHYKSKTQWRVYTWPDITRGDSIAGGEADAYIYCDARLAYDYKLTGYSGTIAIAALNLFDRRFDDYPISTSDVGRRVTCEIRFKF